MHQCVTRWRRETENERIQNDISHHQADQLLNGHRAQLADLAEKHAYEAWPCSDLERRA